MVKIIEKIIDSNNKKLTDFAHKYVDNFLILLSESKKETENIDIDDNDARMILLSLRVLAGLNLNDIDYKISTKNISDIKTNMIIDEEININNIKEYEDLIVEKTIDTINKLLLNKKTLIIHYIISSIATISMKNSPSNLIINSKIKVL